MDENKRYYKFIEFAKFIGVSKQTLNKWSKNGRLVPLVDERGKKYYLQSQADDLTTPRYGTRIHSESNWVDLTNIRVDAVYGHGNRYDWKKAAEDHAKVEYFYNNKRGIIVINSVCNNTLSVCIDGKENVIQTTALIKVSLDKITGAINYDFKYKNGERIQSGNTDITIINQERKSGSRFYKYRCNKCNTLNEINEYNIRNKGCCPVCNGRKVVTGINDITTVAPWMIPFFPNSEMAEHYSVGMHKMIQFKCPDCGRIKNKPMTIYTLYTTKSVACVCGDGYSYPNKFMYSVLEQLKKKNVIITFANEFSQSWSKGRRYDFYVMVESKRALLIEMDGGLGHGKNTIKMTKEETLAIDRMKDEMAINHGLEVVRINADKSEKSYLKDEIIDALKSCINLDTVDWETADSFAISNFAKIVCDYYKNNHITVKELADYFGISDTTALRYIHKGELYNWCTYNSELQKKEKNKGSFRQRKIRNNNVLKVCEFYKSNKPILASQMAKIFNINISTILSYLEEGTHYGYEPYDREYMRKCNKRQISELAKKKEGKKVLCFSSDEKLICIYNSVTKAALENKVSKTAICNCCKKKGKSNGLIFRYEDDCELVY